MSRTLIVLVSLIFLVSCERKPAEAPLDAIEISVPYEVETLDPHARDTISDFSIAANFYEPLVRTDHHQKVSPCLARSWENPDLLTWIFHLQPSVQFHDGRSMTADDVVYTFNRILQDTRLEMRDYISKIADVTAIDRNTVRMTTKDPAGVFLQKLNFILIVPEGSGTDELRSRVNGTGPYRNVKWEAGEWIQMQRFEGYWGKKPELKEVRFHLSRSPEEAIEDLRAAESQLVQCNSRTLEEVIQGLPDFEMLRHDSLFVKYLGFDLQREQTPYSSTAVNPFLDLRVRKAMALAIDRPALTAGLPVFAVPVYQPVPPFVYGFNPAVAAQHPDPEQARRLMAEAGYPEGFEVTLHARQILRDTAAAVRPQLSRIGIRVNIKEMPDPEWFRAMERQDASFFVTRLGAPTGDAGDILAMGFHSQDFALRMGTKNYGRYRNPVTDRAIEESLATMDNEKRGRMMQNIMAQLVADMVWLPLYVDEEVYAIDKRLSWTPRNDSYVLAREIKLKRKK